MLIPKQPRLLSHRFRNLLVPLHGPSDPENGYQKLQQLRPQLAAELTEPGGRLILTHVEDVAAFERYIAVIGKIPEIDTDAARQEILDQLLKEPRDYIDSCRRVLEEEGVPLSTIDEVVTLGHHLADYKRFALEHDVNLLVLNTKDEDQLAMHGMAYALAVELRQIPLLML